MTTSNRRSFLKKTFSGIAGSTLLLASTKDTLLAEAKSIERELGSSSDSENYWDVVKNHFSLQKGLFYFNNASLGPSPELVLDATEKFRRALESFPSKYMWGGWNDDKEEVRKKAAKIFNVSTEEIALIHNTTEGMNIVASSMNLQPGDEVVVADHEHPSGTIPWKYWQETKGIKLVRPKLPMLPKTPGEIVDVYKKVISSKTKVISMCHMINTNGMILPVKEISELAKKRNVLVAVDGAQSAGMFRFNLHELGCDFYAASSHKWLFSPKGMGVFYAKQDSQKYLKPLIVASGYQNKSVRRFENYNTRNLPELLGLGTAIDFNNLIGLDKKEKRIYELKKYFREKLKEETYFKVKTPEHDQLSAGITTVEVEGTKVTELQKILSEKYNIDCRPMSSFGLNGLRISLSIFNTKEDIDYLVDSFKKIKG
jgi:selenocysteine lyase/cysteine desulfurase